LLPVHKKFEVATTRQLSHPLPVPAAKAGCPIQAVFWLEWDNTVLDQWWWMDKASTTAALVLIPAAGVGGCTLHNNDLKRSIL
jgi:hypothetical protein